MLLALETSGKSGSVALARSDGMIVNRETDPNVGSARTLAATIRALLSSESVRVSELKAIAVTVGPGSFTGLRVGVAVAKTMAFGLKIPTIAVDSLTALLRNRQHIENADELWGVMDAYRGELFVAGESKTFDGRSASEAIPSSTITDAQAWQSMMRARIADARRTNRRMAIVGTGLGRLKDFVGELGDEPHVSLLPDRKPEAREVALVGLELWKSGQTVDPFRLMPVYFRASAAEEKLRTNPAG